MRYNDQSRCFNVIIDKVRATFLTYRIIGTRNTMTNYLSPLWDFIEDASHTDSNNGF